MEKIAVISDVHGNLEALKTVLGDIKQRGLNKIYCLGDVIGKGARPNECMDLLKNSQMVYGNWEECFSKEMYSNELGKKRHDILNEKLSVENKKRIKELPFSIDIFISGRLVRMFHATPNNAWDNVLEIDRIEKLYEQFLPTKNTGEGIADVVIYSHTHMQNLMKLYNRTLINTGSVGNSYDIIRNDNKDAKCENTTNADYLIVEGEFGSKEFKEINFQFVSLNYDKQIELKSNENDFEFEVHSKEILSGKTRNFKKYEKNFKEAFYDLENI